MLVVSFISSFDVYSPQEGLLVLHLVHTWSSEGAAYNSWKRQSAWLCLPRAGLAHSRRARAPPGLGQPRAATRSTSRPRPWEPFAASDVGPCAPSRHRPVRKGTKRAGAEEGQ